jgi:DNA-binding GntR family transcriptional regulator
VSVARTLTPVTNVTRRDAVLTELRTGILTGRLMPGDRLKEVQLAQQLGVSRPTLREAIYQLIHEGLLVQETYKGVTVAQIDAQAVSDIAVVRVALESLAAKTIAAAKSGASREALRKAHEAYDEASAGDDPVVVNQAHLALHETIWIESGNIMLRRIWPIVSAPINLALSTDLVVRHDSERDRRMHRQLVNSILENRPREITSVVREHIQVSADELSEMLKERARLG